MRNNVEALYAAGYLERYATTFIDHPQSRLASFLKSCSAGLRTGVSRRKSPNIPWDYIITHPYGELFRSFGSAILKNPRLTHWAWSISQPRFDMWTSKRLGENHNLIYLYEQCGYRTAQRAKALGKMVVVEQVSQHQDFLKRVLTVEIARGNDSLEVKKELALCEPHHFWNEYRNAELKLADAVFCNSEFTKRTLVESGFGSHKFYITPLGCPPVSAAKVRPERTIFMHAGTESIRKGTHLLYAAWNQVAHRPNTELWFAGATALDRQMAEGLSGTVKRFGSIPQAELFARMSEASVLVVPTLADGFGMVITEALARGLPVITTTAAGAADLVRHKEAGGIVIAPQDLESLVDAMHWCIDNPESLHDLGTEGQNIAKAWQWSDYQREFARNVERAYSDHTQRQNNGHAVRHTS